MKDFPEAIISKLEKNEPLAPEEAATILAAVRGGVALAVAFGQSQLLLDSYAESNGKAKAALAGAIDAMKFSPGPIPGVNEAAINADLAELSAAVKNASDIGAMLGKGLRFLASLVFA